MSEGKITRVEDMPVFGLFYQIALDLERITRPFKYDFRWLRSQVLRSSESVSANMAEGFYAQYSTEYLQSLYRSRREGRETMVHVNYAKDVGVIESTVHDDIINRLEVGLKQLNLLMNSIERKIAHYGKAKKIPMLREELEEYETAQPSTINH